LRHTSTFDQWLSKVVESESIAESFTYDEALAGLCSVPQNWRGAWLQAAIPGGRDWFASLQIKAWTKKRHLDCQALVPKGARLPLGNSPRVRE